MKRDLEIIKEDRNAEINYEQGTSSIRVSQRNISGQRGFSNALCLFCEKVDKYQKGSRTREPLFVQMIEFEERLLKNLMREF